MGIIKVDQKLESPGNEKSFLTLVYNYIMDLWDGITCTMTLGDGTVIENADPDDMVWSNNENINIDFTLKTNVVLRLQVRINADMPVDQNTNRAYNVLYMINGAVIAGVGSNGGDTRQAGGLRFCASSQWPKYYTEKERKYLLSKYISDDVFIVWFGNYDCTSWKNSNLFIMGIKDTSDNWHYAGGTNIDNATFYDSTGSNGATKSPMFSYEARTGYLDFISHSSFVTGSTKAFTSTDIYDCTSVNFGDTLSLKDGANFLAIGTHSMVPINDEEE